MPAAFGCCPGGRFLGTRRGPILPARGCLRRTLACPRRAGLAKRALRRPSGSTPTRGSTSCCFWTLRGAWPRFRLLRGSSLHECAGKWGHSRRPSGFRGATGQRMCSGRCGRRCGRNARLGDGLPNTRRAGLTSAASWCARVSGWSGTSCEPRRFGVSSMMASASRNRVNVALSGGFYGNALRAG